MKKRVHLAVLMSLVLTLSIILFATDASALTISNAYPTNQANYNPRLSVEISDSTTPLTVIFETNTTGTWTEIGRQENSTNGVYTYDTTGMDVKNNRYYWRVNVYDGTAWTNQTYSFVAQAFVLKWSYNMGVDTTLGTLAVDVNDDGIYEVFASGEDKIICLDGATGRPLWIYNNSQITTRSPMEISDLNNDGIFEIVFAANERTIALHADDGSVYWNVPVKSQDKQIVIVDTEGNGYPYVYVASEDITQGINGTGRLRKLRGTDGSVLLEVFTWRPCWGGLSADDVNNDGKFEIYMTDRKANYTLSEPGFGKGMQAYDADTLELLWYEDDITCSSHTMGLIDVNNDGVRDAVAVRQSTTNGGLYVIDGATGIKMPGKWADYINLTGHSQFSLWDVDNDGNLELITNYNNVAKVWDIGSWSLDATLDYFEEPPKMADVIGNDELEIIGVSGGANGKIMLYDNKYNNIENVSFPYGHASTLVQDIDNDGQNELIVMTYWGLVRAYDTSAYAPTPRVRTNALYYSERRLGAGVYVPPPGAPQAFIKEESPGNNSFNISLNPTLSFRAVDYRHDLLDIEISTDASGSWEIVAAFDDVENGVYSYTPDDMNEEGTTYNWRVKVIDSQADKIEVTKTFSFITLGANVVCGDGNMEGTEACDDNNVVADDGCSATCTVEAGYTCNGNPSVCTLDCVATDEVCDGIDNDCNPLTLDGSEDPAVGGTCDGADSDMCKEGLTMCSFGGLVCADLTDDALEVCNGLDDDCDGTTDEGCECTNDATRACGSDVGSCVAGTQSCVAGLWSTECVGEVTSTIEVCDGADNDCDGSADENLAESLNPLQMGVCAGSKMICQGVSGWVNMYPTTYEIIETSCDDLDNDCDGSVDEEIVSCVNDTNNTISACTLADSIWDEDSSLNNAYNLSECFADLFNGSVIYRVSGNSSINVEIGIDGSVNLSAPANWHGFEYVVFNASAGNRSAISNSVMLLVRSVPDCGDAICEGGETCSNCAADCGKCSSSGGGGGGGGRSGSYRSTSSVSTSQNVTNTSIKSDVVVEVVCSDWSSCKLGTQQRTCTGNKTIIEERICPSSEQTTNGPSTSSLLMLNASDSDDLNLQKSLLTGAVTGTNKGSRPIWIVIIIVVIVSLVAVQILIKRKIKRKSF